jgi:hypothetical protein
MNEVRRKELQKAASIIESVVDDEEVAFENLPESFQDGEQGQKMTETVDKLREALEEIEIVIYD